MTGEETLHRCAAALKRAQAMIITTGAGMGVDSGLPDFRGDRGFWQAYPPYEKLGLSFTDAASPTHFERDPAFGWGFYGHRTHLYRSTVPHAGFDILKQWSEQLNLDTFVVTSNVDGQFQKAGFPPDRVLEVHGSIHHLQCTTPCQKAIWENNAEIPVDMETMRAGSLPECPRCGAVARPNILMFGDYSWLSSRTRIQEKAFDSFLSTHRDNCLVVVELGAGTALPTIRRLSENLGAQFTATVIRINPRESLIAPPHLSLPCGALGGLKQIDDTLRAMA